MRTFLEFTVVWMTALLAVCAYTLLTNWNDPITAPLCWLGLVSSTFAGSLAAAWRSRLH